jgi:DNA-binding GntR family transcriptional regulator
VEFCELKNIVDNEVRDAQIEEQFLLSDQVVKLIREMISSGALGPGFRVNEVDIANRLGISRGPVREAVRKLVSTGLLVQEKNAGSKVFSPDKKFIHELFDVREALESLSARLAAHLMDDLEKASLVRALDFHEELMGKSEVPNYQHGGADWDFHLLIMKGARNQLIWRICGIELGDVFALLRAQHSSGGASRGRQALLEHRWVADAISSGNGDLAATLMAQHIRASRDNLLKRF